MSDVSQGPGWWQASDGKWYSPEQHPDYQPPAATEPRPPPAVVATAAPPAPPGPGWWQATDGNWYPPQAAGAWQQQAPKKPVYKRVWFWLLMVLAAIVVLIIALIAAAGTAIDHAAHVTHTVVYSVTGSGQANDITYSTLQQGSGQNGEAQETNVNLPWTKTITASGLFTVFDLTASVGQNGGTATCTITYDGRQVASNTANGAFATASCNYSP